MPALTADHRRFGGEWPRQFRPCPNSLPEITVAHRDPNWVGTGQSCVCSGSNQLARTQAKGTNCVWKIPYLLFPGSLVASDKE